MIDIENIKSACVELHRRTSLSIELIDSAGNVIASAASRNSTKNKEQATVVLRTDKRYSARISDKLPISDTLIQVVAMYLEPYFVAKTPEEMICDIISDNITKEAFLQYFNEAHTDAQFQYRVYLMKCTSSHADEILEISKEILNPDSKDMILKLNSENIIFIKECDEEISCEDALELSNALYQSISMEIARNDMYIAVSSVFNSLTDVKKAYISASNTLRIGTACNYGKNVFIAEKLRLEELLDTLPHDVLVNILELYSANTISEAWDDRMIETVQSLFDNNLNLSVTARELYTHRNTLVYRLDKIKKISGFDLRSFDDAVMLKIIMTADKLNIHHKNNN